MILQPAHLLICLNGAWQLERKIVSNVSPIGQMEGVATFTPVTQITSRYFEEGSLTLLNTPEKAPSISFSRSYFYSAHDGMLFIEFDEDSPRSFQHLELRGEAEDLVGAAQHTCSLDSYRSSYRFKMPNTSSICHQVSGPRQDYTIMSLYQRSN